jgi:hypothetical protein
MYSPKVNFTQLARILHLNYSVQATLLLWVDMLVEFQSPIYVPMEATLSIHWKGNKLSEYKEPIIITTQFCWAFGGINWQFCSNFVTLAIIHKGNLGGYKWERKVEKFKNHATFSKIKSLGWGESYHKPKHRYIMRCKKGRVVMCILLKSPME